MRILMNGIPTPREEATLSVFDRGFLFGDAIYEVVCTHRGQPVFLGPHLERLEASGQAIGLDVRPWRGVLEDEIARLCAKAAGEGELYIRVVMTRGLSPGLDLDEALGDPLRIVLVKPLAPWPQRLVEEGLHLRSVGPEEIVGRVAPWVKSNNRQANVMAHRLARAEGADDALFVDPSGHITEGPSWNIFCVKDAGLATPPLERGLLPGITRAKILELCAREGLACEERGVPIAEARAADELFVTSTTRGVMGVAELDGKALAAGPGPGPVTRRLRDALQALTEAS